MEMGECVPGNQVDAADPRPLWLAKDEERDGVQYYFVVPPRHQAARGNKEGLTTGYGNHEVPRQSS